MLIYFIILLIILYLLTSLLLLLILKADLLLSFLSKIYLLDNLIVYYIEITGAIILLKFHKIANKNKQILKNLNILY